MDINIHYVWILDNISGLGYNGFVEKIEFVSTIPGLAEVEELTPKPAKHFVPQWFKNIPSENQVSVKYCPSFPDYFSQGYIVPMWSDSFLQYNDQDRSWVWRSSNPRHAPSSVEWQTHHHSQFIDYVKPSFNGVEGQFIFKALCPWRIITAPGWSVLQLPLFYHFNREWSILPGIIDTDIHHEINQQVLYHGNGEGFTIKRATPFVLYIPFKRKNKLNAEIRDANPKDIKLFNKQDYRISSGFPANGIYRLLQRQRDKSE